MLLAPFELILMVPESVVWSGHDGAEATATLDFAS